LLKSDSWGGPHTIGRDTTLFIWGEIKIFVAAKKEILSIRWQFYRIESIIRVFTGDTLSLRKESNEGGGAFIFEKSGKSFVGGYKGTQNARLYHRV